MENEIHPEKPQWQSPHGRALPDASRTLIMGIINITPDSFSDGGKLTSPQAAAARAGELLAAGANVLDIGGESTRPGHAAVSEAEEIARVLPVIEAVRAAFPAAPISVDTYKAGVARAAVRAGADMVNDVWRGFGDTLPHLGSARVFGDTLPKPGSARVFGSTMPHLGRARGFGGTMPHPGSAKSFGDTMPHPGSARDFGDTLPHPERTRSFSDTMPHPGSARAFDDTLPHTGSARDFSDTMPHPGSAGISARETPASDLPNAQRKQKCPRSQADPPPMARVVAELRCPIILMHNRPAPDYTDFWPDVLADLQTSIDAMRSAGVDAGQIWTDPGFGFAKDAAQNLEVLKNLSQLVALGYPVLLGTSRKSTIGRVLKKQIPTDREDGTAATLVWGIQQGARMVRMHDVAAMRPFVQMADAIRAGITWKEYASQPPV